MKVICTESGRFQFEINIEEYISDLEKLGIEQQTPIIIKIPCKICKRTEQYKIYKNRFIMEPENKRH